MTSAFPFDTSKGVLKASAPNDPAESLILSIANIFISINAHQIDTGINRALEHLGFYASADRCWLIEVCGDKGTNTHEWCASGVPPAISVIQNMPINTVPYFTEVLARGEVLSLHSVRDLPREAVAERMLCEASKTKSFLAVPIVKHGELIGIFGYDQVFKERKFGQDLIRVLLLVSDLFATALQRRKEYREQQELDLKYRTVLDTLREGVVMSDLEGKILYCNSYFADMVGYRLNELLGEQSFKLLVPEQEWEKLLENSRNRMFGLTDSFKVTLKRKNGEPLTAEIKTVPYKNISGEIIGFIVTFFDITNWLREEEDKKRIASHLLYINKMAAVNHIAAGVAHDLNNSLSAVTGHLQMIRELDESPPLARESADIALQGCSRATRLVHQLLSFSKPKTADFEFVAFKQVIEDTIDLISSSLSKQVDIRCTGTDTNIIISADRAQLEQVLTNLILNAQQAMAQDGTIHIRCSRTHIDRPELHNKISRAGFFAVLTVSDTGVGIPEDLLSRVFEPFFTTREAGGGHGLGLAMVNTIVQNHGGWVEVNSQVGQGTEFSIYLPEVVIDEKKSVIEIPSELSPAHSPYKEGKILILEDEPILADLATRFLERAGFQTKAFCAPREAIRWYNEFHDDVALILLDMKMPGMNGVESFRAIRSIDPHAKVVLISGFFEERELAHLLKEGALSYIRKPVQYNELVEWIRKTMRSSQSSELFH